MKVPVWLDRTDALAIHEMMLAQYGGLAGVRDEGLLESALAKPQNLFAYAKPSLAELAASYAAGVVLNHPFLDGNKRTGFMLAATFLELNGRSFNATEESVVQNTLGLASGKLKEAGYAVWLKGNSEAA
ncbi:MAG TPA: type II toxin-antitoxin system death-on-curing family toxin [Candidatus Acidoferrum sp.]|jgi:death-on-curing protein|nr:type II toxin-antitoxin system death-on-curing family toxin [Candidatus Acidoferrum sp.]